MDTTFAAGNIALSICQMLTTDDKQVADEEQADADHVAETAKEGAGTNDVEMMDVDEGSEGPATQSGRGRQHARRGPRKALAESSTPPMRSIETIELDDGDGEEKRGPVRTPGDYHLCRALLATAYHRWVECRNCDEYFVQENAYQTRIACPRCERHSKLYGYWWPKTEKEGKLDKEERVLDHRTIHRFVEPDEERHERKGRKTLVSALREMSSRQESEESEMVGVEKRLRNSPKRSESRRKMRSTM